MEGKIVMIISKVTDYLLFYGAMDYIIDFFHHISTLFTIRKSILDGLIKFSGFTITQYKERNIQINMREYMGER